MTEVMCCHLAPLVRGAARRISVVDWWEDAEQEAWLRVIQVEDRESGQSIAYLAQTARHATMDFVRRQCRRRGMVRLDSTPEPEYWDMASIELLLEELQLRDRRLLVAYMAAGGDTSVLGRALRISTRSARREVQRLRKMVLYHLLGQEGASE